MARFGRSVLLALAVWCVSLTSVFAEPIIGMVGHRFTINGVPRFLVFISYFDAMQASDTKLHQDFAYFRDNRIDGVRIFVNWWACVSRTQCGGNYSSQTLFQGISGVPHFRAGRLDQLKHVLDLAASYNLVVDVTFTRETVAPPGLVFDEAYEDRIAETAQELLVGYRHVIFDIQNEVNIHGLYYDGTSQFESIDQSRYIRKQVDLADPDRIVFASGANEIVNYTHHNDGWTLDVAAVHDERVPNWHNLTDDVIANVFNRMDVTGKPRKPIYLQEPTAFDNDPDASHHFTAVQLAKSAGAAAWTFHTRSGFILRSGQGLYDQAPSAERFFIENFRYYIP